MSVVGSVSGEPTKLVPAADEAGVHKRAISNLRPEHLSHFSQVTQKSFSEQAISFLNAYWNFVSGEAEFIHSVVYRLMKEADMQFKGISLIHKYQEGSVLNFDAALYFYEQLCKYCEDPKNAHFVSQHPKSVPQMMTAIKRKQEIRDKVDLNFNGTISMLECLLYQYSNFSNLSDYCTRSMTNSEHPDVVQARALLEKVNHSIKIFEDEKLRLTNESKLPGVKGLAALSMLAQIESSTFMSELNKNLITAQAALRIANKRCSQQVQEAGAESSTLPSSANCSYGTLWWMNRELDQKKAQYITKARPNHAPRT